MAQLNHSPETSDFNNQLEWLNLLDENTKLEETESLVLNDKDKQRYEWKEIPGIEWLLLCEDPSTKKMFLSDWYRLLTKKFDNIKNISKEWNDMYYVWVNWWKSTLYKSWKEIIIREDKPDDDTRSWWIERSFNWKKDRSISTDLNPNDKPDQEILSNVDDIDYRIINWQLVTIAEIAWKKTVRRGEKILKENCKEAEFNWIVSTTQYQYDEDWGKVSDCWFAISCVEEWWKWSAFINWELYCSWTWYDWEKVRRTYFPQSFFEANWSNIMIIADSRWWKPDESWVSSQIVYYNWNPLGRLKWEIIGMQSLIIRKNNWKYVCLSLSTWNILWSEYDEIYAYWTQWHDYEPNGWFIFNQNHLAFWAKKWWKNICVIDWEDYILDNLNDVEYYDMGLLPYDNNTLFLKKWNKHYYMWKDCMAHEYEWQYDNVDKVWETSDWKVYFIWKKWDKEVFVFDWKPIWKEYDHISWAGVLPWWWVYVQAERKWEKVFILNWTEREEPTSLDKKTVLFSRKNNDY